MLKAITALGHRLFARSSDAEASPEAPSIEEAPIASKANDRLQAILAGHGLPIPAYGEWLLPYSDLPAICAVWHGDSGTRLLEVIVKLPDGTEIVEGFAGTGDLDAAFDDAFDNFMRSSLHVMLSGLWGVHDPEQIDSYNWEIAGKRYTAFIGNYVSRSTENSNSHVPPKLDARLTFTIQRERLTQEFHWFRLFVANMQGQFVFEALKDNEDWPAGLDCLNSCDWPTSDGYYSLRQFVLLRAKPVDGQ